MKSKKLNLCIIFCIGDNKPRLFLLMAPGGGGLSSGVSLLALWCSVPLAYLSQ